MAEGSIGGTPISKLPDSSFAYVEPGHGKDDDGDTPDQYRHFPIRDKNGKPDRAHVEAAMARLDQSPFGDKARAAVMKAAKELGMDMMRSAPVGQFETRESAWPDLEMRATRDGLVVEGYAVPFDRPSNPIPGGPRGTFRETMRSGVFTRSLGLKPDVLMKYQHNHLAFPLGRTTAGTLQLSADSGGLIYRNVLPDNEAGRPVYDAIERRDITGVSISFMVRSPKNQQWSDDGQERQVFEAELGHEISYVDHPAYPATTAVTIRSLGEEAGADPELIRIAELILSPDERISVEDYQVLMAVVTQRTDAPFVDPASAKVREFIAAHAAA